MGINLILWKDIVPSGGDPLGPLWTDYVDLLQTGPTFTQHCIDNLKDPKLIFEAYAERCRQRQPDDSALTVHLAVVEEALREGYKWDFL